MIIQNNRLKKASNQSCKRYVLHRSYSSVLPREYYFGCCNIYPLPLSRSFDDFFYVCKIRPSSNVGHTFFMASYDSLTKEYEYNPEEYKNLSKFYCSIYSVYGFQRYILPRYEKNHTLYQEYMGYWVLGVKAIMLILEEGFNNMDCFGLDRDSVFTLFMFAINFYCKKSNLITLFKLGDYNYNTGVFPRDYLGNLEGSLEHISERDKKCAILTLFLTGLAVIDPFAKLGHQLYKQ
jgi:hypothetical protein